MTGQSLLSLLVRGVFLEKVFQGLGYVNQYWREKLLHFLHVIEEKKAPEV